MNLYGLYVQFCSNQPIVVIQQIVKFFNKSKKEGMDSVIKKTPLLIKIIYLYNRNFGITDPIITRFKPTNVAHYSHKNTSLTLSITSFFFAPLPTNVSHRRNTPITFSKLTHRASLLRS